MIEKQQILKDVGLKVRHLREKKELTLMDFSILTDIEYTNVIRIEKGRTNPTVGTLVKIANALNVSLHELMP
jgi:transcriptional regulator with XRE-family HTH domain